MKAQLTYDGLSLVVDFGDGMVIRGREIPTLGVKMRLVANGTPLDDELAHRILNKAAHIVASTGTMEYEAFPLELVTA